MSEPTTAADWKAQGNACLSNKDFDGAIDAYTKAIELDGSNHVFYSNRSAAYLSKNDAENALADADRCIGAKGDWAKGYSRKGAALHALGRYEDAQAAYEEGLKVDPNNAACKEGVETVSKAASGPGAGGLGGLFGADTMSKIAQNPKLRGYLSDPSYLQAISEIQRNPNNLGNYQHDPRIMETLGALMGLNMEGFGGGAGAGGASADAGPSSAPASAPAPAPAPAPAAEPLTEEEIEERKAAEAARAEARRVHDEAMAHKARGNDFYKNKEFEAALAAYDKAVELEPTDLSYRNNRAAVFLEQRDFERCLEELNQAVEVGRENRGAFTLMAKLLVRKATCYQKMGDLANAIEALQSAQLEDYSRDVDKKLKKLMAQKRKADAEAYVNPELALEAKERGNEFFRNGDYPSAITEYDEAVRRHPTSPIYYANRAAALTKLTEFSRAKEDCNKALELDPTYVKAWSRLGAIQFFMKEYHKATESYGKGLELDPENAECKEGLQRTLQKIRTSSGENDEERAAHGMADPEIQQILSDPMMQQVLQDLQGGDQRAAQAHMSDPGVVSKINKLIAAGVLRTG